MGSGIETEPSSEGGMNIGWIESTAAGVLNIIQQVPNSAPNSLRLPVLQSDGPYSFWHQNSGQCLDVYGANSTLGQQLDQRQCKNASGTNQDFTPR